MARVVPNPVSLRSSPEPLISSIKAFWTSTVTKKKEVTGQPVIPKKSHSFSDLRSSWSSSANKQQRTTTPPPPSQALDHLDRSASPPPRAPTPIAETSLSAQRDVTKRVRRPSAATHTVITAEAFPLADDDSSSDIKKLSNRDSGVFDLDSTSVPYLADQSDEKTVTATPPSPPPLQFSEMEIMAISKALWRLSAGPMGFPPQPEDVSRKLSKRKHMSATGEDFNTYISRISYEKLSKARPLVQQVQISNLIQRVQFSDQYKYWPFHN
ncbi:hypothetical protein BCR33DRAFT_845757 [Rhizoclosmatium globosum]|uniref:Uncharacterized protein n=1 Tax=Rhizoclosmatium globosum TaxID=329046 RepID=A0A1Y2D029_9FUNG|nr:hypothetical protein BCR33DRAFT_845757 [Rhizoclosmatium globosum]|eukprot:ORY52649.1 hypothetical protein BCR33DRAFT_845757 [Rhizoclosmatium globosum]